MKHLYALIESPLSLDLEACCHPLNIRAQVFNSTRKTLQALKKHAPDFIVAEFRYGYSNHYAGINISNLDVLLYALPKYAPTTQVLLLCNEHECTHAQKLEPIFPLRAILTWPVSVSQLQNHLHPYST